MIAASVCTCHRLVALEFSLGRMMMCVYECCAGVLLRLWCMHMLQPPTRRCRLQQPAEHGSLRADFGRRVCVCNSNRRIKRLLLSTL